MSESTSVLNILEHEFAPFEIASSGAPHRFDTEDIRLRLEAMFPDGVSMRRVASLGMGVENQFYLCFEISAYDTLKLTEEDYAFLERLAQAGFFGEIDFEAEGLGDIRISLRNGQCYEIQPIDGESTQFASARRPLAPAQALAQERIDGAKSSIANWQPESPDPRTALQAFAQHLRATADTLERQTIESDLA